MRSMLCIFGLLAAVPGCSHETKRAPSPAASTASAGVSGPSPNTKGTLAIGERITEPMVPLTAIAASPSKYANRVVATTGKVTAVCQEMGCWMEIQDASGQAHIRMHGHSFFVPKTASGHMARVQATVVPHDGDKDCEEAPPSSDRPLAKVDLDATGVELDYSRRSGELTCPI